MDADGVLTCGPAIWASIKEELDVTDVVRSDKCFKEMSVSWRNRYCISYMIRFCDGYCVLNRECKYEYSDPAFPENLIAALSDSDINYSRNGVHVRVPA